MRVVSWIIVAGSVIWLLGFGTWSSIGSISNTPIDESMVRGSAMSSPPESARAFAKDYVSAWNSGDPSRVASFYAPDGAIVINGGVPSEGTAGITGMANGFMTVFPDIDLDMVSLEEKGDRWVFHWIFTGTHIETGQSVRISGSETWKLNENGLILNSVGKYDVEDYERQVVSGYRN